MSDGRRVLDVALQGGGAHGAFTWGVPDRLLEEDSLEIEGISGTSAGAMNAVALAQGGHAWRPDVLFEESLAPAQPDEAQRDRRP